MTTEECLRCWLLKRVDEDRSSFQTLANALGTGNVLAPDTSTKTSLTVVGTLDNLLLVSPWLSWNDWSERLFLDDPGFIWWVVNDGWLDEEALAGSNVWLANSELVALILYAALVNWSYFEIELCHLRVRKEVLDLLVLHLVLDWTKMSAIHWSADSHRLGEFDHCSQHLLVNVLVNVDTLCGNANLARVLESTHDKLRSNRLDVDIGKND